MGELIPWIALYVFGVLLELSEHDSPLALLWPLKALAIAACLVAGLCWLMHECMERLYGIHADQLRAKPAPTGGEAK